MPEPAFTITGYGNVYQAGSDGRVRRMVTCHQCGQCHPTDARLIGHAANCPDRPVKAA